MSNKTYTTKTKDIERTWHLVDAKGEIIGRLATEISKLLMGKDKVYYSPHMDCGDFVVVVNASDIEVTGNKGDDKIYYRHSGYPGGFKKETFNELLERRPQEVIRKAVSGMLPKNKLRDPRLNRLKVYAGEKHPHKSQFKEN